eukprot:COSAG02_NODE_3388_length_6828_cov_19.910685_2_plen_305_part_00
MTGFRESGALNSTLSNPAAGVPHARKRARTHACMVQRHGTRNASNERTTEPRVAVHRAACLGRHLQRMLGRGITAVLSRSFAITRGPLALVAERPGTPALLQRPAAWAPALPSQRPIVAVRLFATSGIDEPYIGQMRESTPGMEREVDVGAAAQYAAGGPQQAAELHAGRTARDRLTAYAEMRTLIEIETAHDVEEMQKEIRFLAATYKLASERLAEIGTMHCTTGLLTPATTRIENLATAATLLDALIAGADDPSAQEVLDECERRGVLINQELQAVEEHAKECFGEGWMDRVNASAEAAAGQ